MKSALTAQTYLINILRGSFIIMELNMKLCAVSPFNNAKKSEILKFLAKASAELVVLPGYSFCKPTNTPSPSEIKKVIKDNVSVFVESEEGLPYFVPYLVTNKKLIRMPEQIFSEKPTVGELDRLIEILPKRTFSFGKRKVTFFICGEILAFNTDGNFKYDKHLPYSKVVEPTNIVVNPSHNLMGHWNYLIPKLTNLSRKSAAIHVANNNRNRTTITTGTRIYKKGALLLNRQTEGMLSWCECSI
jgi:hypothetical protein